MNWAAACANWENSTQCDAHLNRYGKGISSAIVITINRVDRNELWLASVYCEERVDERACSLQKRVPAYSLHIEKFCHQARQEPNHKKCFQAWLGTQETTSCCCCCTTKCRLGGLFWIENV